MQHLTHRVQIVVDPTTRAMRLAPGVDPDKCDCAARWKLIRKCAACKRLKPRLCAAHRTDHRVKIVIAEDGSLRHLQERDSGDGEWRDE